MAKSGIICGENRTDSCGGNWSTLFYHSQHFMNNSISLEMLQKLTDDIAIMDSISINDKVRLNLKGIVWVIDRIQVLSKNLTEEEYMSNEEKQDAITRNIQLMSQIVSQIPVRELDKLNGINVSVLKGCITLKEALFMNVDHSLLWRTLDTELNLLKISIQQIIDEREEISKSS